jgi:hypothetical protein
VTIFSSVLGGAFDWFLRVKRVGDWMNDSLLRKMTRAEQDRDRERWKGST